MTAASLDLSKVFGIDPSEVHAELEARWNRLSFDSELTALDAHALGPIRGLLPAFELFGAAGLVHAFAIICMESGRLSPSFVDRLYTGVETNQIPALNANLALYRLAFPRLRKLPDAMTLDVFDINGDVAHALVCAKGRANAAQLQENTDDAVAKAFAAAEAEVFELVLSVLSGDLPADDFNTGAEHMLEELRRDEQDNDHDE